MAELAYLARISGPGYTQAAAREYFGAPKRDFTTCDTI